MLRSLVRKAYLGPTVLLVIAAGGILLAVREFIPMGPDYFFHFRPMADQWLGGQFSMYDPAYHQLFYPPWSLAVIVPLGLFSLRTGHAVLFLFSLGSILVSVRILEMTGRIPWYAWVLILVNLHTFDMFIRGQLDSFVLIGIVLGWWAIRRRNPLALSLAFLLMTIKPPLNVGLTGLLFLIAIRRWSWREIALALSMPAVAAIISGLILGFDWPLHIINRPAPVIYLSISLWRGTAMAGLPAWPVATATALGVIAFLRVALRDGLTERTLCLALATNLLFTPYANGDHYALLIPALIYLARRNWRLTLLAYLATWTPLLRLVLGYDAAIIDIFYPMILFAGSWMLNPAPQSLHASPPERTLAYDISPE